MNVILLGTVTGINTLKDGTVKTSLCLQEVGPETIGQLYQLNNQYVKVYMTTENITQEASKELDNLEIELEGKSPSKRMKNVLYRLWEQDPEGYEDSELYYRNKMNKIIEHLKAKLI